MHVSVNRYSVRLSDCLSVCLSSAVLCLNEWPYRHTLLTFWYGIILVFGPRPSPPLQASKGNLEPCRLWCSEGVVPSLYLLGG